MFKEFKKFAMRGNIMDLAVGVVIGGAFQTIVNDWRYRKILSNRKMFP